MHSELNRAGQRKVYQIQNGQNSKDACRGQKNIKRLENTMRNSWVSKNSKMYGQFRLNRESAFFKVQQKNIKKHQNSKAVKVCNDLNYFIFIALKHGGKLRDRIII